eukprot:4347693-Pleurochrysis_carterae.AAC.1
MLADASAQRALQNECRWGGRFNRSVTMLQRAHPFGRRVHYDMKAYHLGADALLQSTEVREAAVSHYIQSQAAVERAVATRYQVDAVEAPAVAPAVAQAAASSSSTAASTATSNEVQARYRRNLAAREARERAALLARQLGTLHLALLTLLPRHRASLSPV